MTKLSKSFTLEELVFSQTAARESIDNTPAPAHIRAMRDLCTHILQPLRDSVGMPIVVSSGYRCARLNRFVGGSVSSSTAPEAQSTCGDGASTCNVFGNVPCRIAMTILMTPPTPAAAWVCPMFDLIEPSHSGSSPARSWP